MADTTKIMVTGASGFIGRQCIRNLLNLEGVEIHAVRNKQIVHDPSNVIVWHHADLLVDGAIEKLIETVRPKTLLHLAWYSKHGTVWNSAENVSWTSASLRLVKTFAACGGDRFVMSGTCAEYKGSGVFRECSMETPASLYGVTKKACRDILEALCAHLGVSFAWPILFHMYGPYESPSRLIASAINNFLRGEEFHSSDSLQRRDFLYVEDVGAVLSAILLSDVRGAINVGSGETVSLRDLLLLAEKECGAEGRTRFGSRARTMNDPDVLVPDLTRQRVDLGWRPKYDAASGIKATVDWWRARNAAEATQA